MPTQLLQGSRRLFVMGPAALAAAGLGRRAGLATLAQETGEDAAPRAEALALLADYGFLWSATSPATRLDDEATIVLTNRSAGPLDVWVRTTIMDHRAHYNEPVIDENVSLAAGDSHTLYAVNTYGPANHFSTRMAARTGDPLELGVEVTLTDGSGTETASFNELAFWVKTYDEVLADIEARREEVESNGHAGH